MTSSVRDSAPAAAASGRRVVFLDAAILLTAEPRPGRHDAPRATVPGAADAMAHLRDGHDLVLVAPDTVGGVPELAGTPVVAAVPASFPVGSWYITADGSWCEGDRPAGLRTILVGPRRPPARRPTLRCDIEARDLSAAVMEILVRETMA